MAFTEAEAKVLLGKAYEPPANTVKRSTYNPQIAKAQRDERKMIAADLAANPERDPCTYHFTLPYPPLLNAIYKMSRSGTIYLTDEGKKFKADAWQSIRPFFKSTPFRHPVSVIILTFRPHARGDIDAVAKLALDCMEGIVYRKDSGVDHLEITKVGQDPTNPRLEVSVREI